MQGLYSILSGLKVYKRPKILAIAFLGFSSGLPLPLTFATLTAWLDDAGVSKTSIGLFALLGTPYVLKFLWAPLVDQLSIPFFTRKFGRRTSWMILFQILLMGSLFALGLTNPAEELMLTATIALLVAFFSASQDIVIDAYRVELLPEEEQGAGAAGIVLGYNIAMKLIGGAFALILADLYNWTVVYSVMAALISVGMITVLLTGEPENNEQHKAENWLAWVKHAVIDPFADFMARPGWIGILCFIIFFKFGDAFAGVMTTPFLLDIDFTKTEIGIFLKSYGLAATLVGTFLGGIIVYRLGIIPALWICGILQMLSNLVFVAQAMIGRDLGMLTITISVENLSSGMGTAAFVAYLSSLCHVSYTATQYALLSSLAAFGRTWLSSSSGWFVDNVGWVHFFYLSTLFALPGLLLLWWMTHHVRKTTAQAAPISQE